jgi:hypothetical protein
MNRVIANIQAWFVSKGGVTHVMAVLFVGTVGAFGAVPDFHHLCLKLYHALPGWAEEIVLAAVGIYAWYRVSLSPAGTMAAARVVKTLDDVPSAKQVDAATMK